MIKIETVFARSPEKFDNQVNYMLGNNWHIMSISCGFDNGPLFIAIMKHIE